MAPAPPSLPEPPKDTSGASFPIVALGASAGGLAAVTQLLHRLGAKPGLAVVLVQHLDPTRVSNLVELLSRVTPLAVEAVHEGVTVAIDCVYVIPPGAAMTIERGVLHLSPRLEAPAPHLPIDAFFESLAEDRGPGAVGVILSGTGSDGARGIQAIKAEGGITFAQEGAEHTGMPQSAIATGAVDFTLPAEQIAIELSRIAASQPHPPEQKMEEGPAFDRILAAIRQGTGVDFTHYKPTTLRRRMQRRAIVRRVASLAEYADIVETEPAEAEALSEEVLIHVTSFFRDPQVFEALKADILPRLLSNRRADQPIRVWIPGCSSGEEVYSVAICLLELLADSGASQIPLKLFGTDVSRRAVERARAGTYPDSIAEDVGPGRLARFFVKTERGYQVVKEVRDRCVFAIHDITRDPPFSKMDLISCRNLMIYLGPALQQQILPMFQYALNERGLPGRSCLVDRAPEGDAKLFARSGSRPQTRVSSRCFSPIARRRPRRGRCPPTQRAPTSSRR
jgi:two-component system CheB/CheR fusion protein